MSEILGLIKSVGVLQPIDMGSGFYPLTSLTSLLLMTCYVSLYDTLMSVYAF